MIRSAASSWRGRMQCSLARHSELVDELMLTSAAAAAASRGLVTSIVNWVELRAPGRHTRSAAIVRFYCSSWWRGSVSCARPAADG